MKNVHIEDAFSKELSMLWSNETLLLQVLPEMMGKATDFGLKASLATHFAETEQQKTTLEFVLKQIERVPEELPTTELGDLINSGNQTIADVKAGNARDIAIVAAAKKVEQYEIAKYTSAVNHAEQLGLKLVAKRLKAIRLEEQQTEGKLSFLGKNISGNNAQAG